MGNTKNTNIKAFEGTIKLYNDIIKTAKKAKIDAINEFNTVLDNCDNIENWCHPIEDLIKGDYDAEYKKAIFVIQANDFIELLTVRNIVMYDNNVIGENGQFDVSPDEHNEYIWEDGDTIYKLIGYLALEEWTDEDDEDND